MVKYCISYFNLANLNLVNVNKIWAYEVSQNVLINLIAHLNIQKLKMKFIWHTFSMSPNTIHSMLWWMEDNPLEY